MRAKRVLVLSADNYFVCHYILHLILRESVLFTFDINVLQKWSRIFYPERKNEMLTGVCFTSE